MESDTEPKFEDILDGVGNMGPAQILIIIFGCALDLTSALAYNFYVIETGSPGYSCIPVDRNTSAVIGNATWNGCPTPEAECVNVTFSKEYTSPTTEWQYICGTRYRSRLMATLFFAGGLLGGLASGQIADIFGRRTVGLAAWGLTIVSMALLAVAPSWPVYSFQRILTGFFAVCTSPTACTLPIEYVGPKWRVFVALRIGWRLADFGIVLFVYFLREWRHLVLGLSLTWIPFFVLGCIFLPESSRWLIHKKRYGDAHKSLLFISKLNRRPPPDLDLIRRLGDRFKEHEEEDKKYSYHDLFRTRFYTKITLVLLFAWFTCACISYGMKSEIPNMTGSIYQNLLVAASANLVARLLAPLVINCIGRRWSFSIFSAIPIISMVIILALDLTGYMEGREGIRSGLALASYGSATGNWMLADVYSCEVYPTMIRNIGLSSGTFISGIGSVVAPQIGLLSNVHASLPYVLIGTLGLLASIFTAWLMPETKDKPLPEELPPRKRRRAAEEGSGQEGNAETDKMNVTTL